jgi:hypothetical protein
MCWWAFFCSGELKGFAAQAFVVAVLAVLDLPCILRGLFACGVLLLAVVLVVLAFPCILIGLLASPLCGAAPTFFAAAKKVGKESGLPTASG